MVAQDGDGVGGGDLENSGGEGFSLPTHSLEILGTWWCVRYSKRDRFENCVVTLFPRGDGRRKLPEEIRRSQAKERGEGWLNKLGMDGCQPFPTSPFLLFSCLDSRFEGRTVVVVVCGEWFAVGKGGSFDAPTLFV